MNLPNKLTLTRILLIPVFVACMETIGTDYYISLIVFAIASFTDFLDGNIARKCDLVTTFGKFMDPLADKLLVLSAFVLLSANGQVPSWITIIILARELAITGFRTIAASKGVILAAGKSGKIKTVTQMMTILIMLTNDLPLLGLSFSLGTCFMYLACVMTIYSGAEYIIKNINVLDLENI